MTARAEDQKTRAYARAKQSRSCRQRRRLQVVPSDGGVARDPTTGPRRARAQRAAWPTLNTCHDYHRPCFASGGGRPPGPPRPVALAPRETRCACEHNHARSSCSACGKWPVEQRGTVVQRSQNGAGTRRRGAPAAVSRGGLLAGIVLALAAHGTVVASSATAAEDPCAKQVAAVRHAQSAHGKRVATRRLHSCRFAHAVSITPASPLANEAVMVTIHPRWPLRKGCHYEVIITDTEGHPGDGFAHVMGKRTRGLSVTIRPAEDSPPFGPPVSEWKPGIASVFVIEGTPRQLGEISLTPKWRQVGGLEFRFLPVK